jgi:hypothetical protein
MISRISWKQASVALSSRDEVCHSQCRSRELVQLHKLLAGLHPRQGTEVSSEAPVLIHR